MSIRPDPHSSPQPGALTALVAELARAPAHGPPPLLMPGTRTGRYEIIRMIGHGGFGTVYEAHDATLNRLVALKTIRVDGAGAPRGGATEGEAAARLAHPNIAALFDAGAIDGGLAYLVYEILHGETLESRLARGPIPPREALGIAAQIARALWHAHTHGVVHRDLKPANVFLTVEGDAKVLDFGMALLFGRAASAGGTPTYMAPEQRRGGPEDARTDLHALGAVLREMLTGSPYDAPGWRDRVPAALVPLLDALLAEDPASRPRSAQVALDALEAAARRLDASGARGRLRGALRAGPGRRKIAVVAAAALATGAAIWAVARRELADRSPLAEARFLQLTDFDGVEQAAAISRDGRFVAFQSDRDGKMDVWVTQLPPGEFKNLTRGGAPEIANPSLRALGFSPDGALVTYWGRQPLAPKGPDISVWAVPLLGGPPRPYLEGVAEYDWTPDGRLVYHTPGPGDPMFVSDAGAVAGARRIFAAPAGLHAHFQLWSPDGSSIYFVQGSLPDRMDLWRIAAAGGEPERVTHHDARVTHPVFLDARTLLYLATDPDGAGPWIFAVDVARPQPRRISTGAERYTSLAASGDGRRLVATRTSPSSTFWRVPLVDGRADLSAGRKIALTTRTGSHPRLGPGYLLYVATTGSGDGLWKLEGEKATELWSAPEARIIGAPGIRGDGRRIAFAVRQRGRALLYAVSPDGTDARVVTSALDLRGAPAWAPDGRSLTVAAVASGAPRLFRVPLDGAAPEQIGGEEGLEPVWSPAGDLLLYSGPDVGTAFPLKAARPDGSPAGLAPLTLSRGARHVAFGPGPRALVVLRGDLRHRDLWRIELDTGAERRVTDVGPGFDLADFDVGPDGRELVLEQLQERSDIVLIERAPP